MLLLFIVVIGSYSSVQLSHADQYLTRQITDNTANDSSPSLYKDQIAWYGNEDGTYAIYYWDGSNTTKISDNSSNAYNPSLDNGQITWQADKNGKSQIYFWDGKNTTKISKNSKNNYNPSLYNGQITWQADKNGKSQIYFWNGSSTTKISKNSKKDYSPSLYNGQITWQGYENDKSQIYFWDGTGTTNISNNSKNNSATSLYHKQITWQGNNILSPSDISLLSGTSIPNMITDILDTNSDTSLDKEQDVQNDKNSNIYFWDGDDTVQISDNSSNDYNPSLYNGQITWQGYEHENYDIYFWDGATITNISDNSSNNYNPSLYNGNIAWYGNKDGDNEIYYAKLASEWIRQALPEVSLLNFNEQEIMKLSDLYSNKSSGLVRDINWTYLSGNLPGDTNGELYEIGDSWVYGGHYYIKLGSGLEGTSAAIPEFPPHTTLAFLSVLFIFMRKKNMFIFLQK